MSEKDTIIVFERGEDISFANCGLPYHISGVISDRDELLLQSPAGFKNRFNVEVRNFSEVISVQRSTQEITIQDLSKNRRYTEKYDVLILSPGAGPFLPPVPGIDLSRIFTLRNLPDMDAIKSKVIASDTKHVAIVGGGYIGLKMVEAIAHLGTKVCCIEQAPQVMGTLDPEMATPLHQHLRDKGVALYLSQTLQSISEQPTGL